MTDRVDVVNRDDRSSKSTMRNYVALAVNFGNTATPTFQTGASVRFVHATRHIHALMQLQPCRSSSTDLQNVASCTVEGQVMRMSC